MSIDGLIILTVVFIVFLVMPVSCGNDDDDDGDDGGGDGGNDESECDSRPSGYAANCEKTCSQESDQCRLECGPDPSGETDGACDDDGWGIYYPNDPAYADYCDCLTACASGWVGCVNECLYPCGEMVI